MATVDKDVLYPGTFTLARGERWECLPAYVRSAVVNGNGMLAKGNVAAPLIWEHDADSGPELLPALLSSLENPRQFAADYARNTFGYATRYWLETVKGDPVAFAKIEVPDATDLSQFRKTRFVSARVMNGFRDPLGNKWQGAVIGHIAATPQPIQVQQRPVDLSQTKPARKSWVSVYLSAEYREGEAVAEENEGKGKGGADAGMSRLMTALSNNGINLPEGISSLDDVCLALETIAANNATVDPEPGEDLDNDGIDDTADATPAGMPAMLSQMTADQQRPWKIIAKQEREKTTNRVARIKKSVLQSGHLTASEFAKMEAHFKGMSDGVMLSIFGHGQKAPTPDKWLMQLENLERLVKVKRQSGAVDLSQTVGVPIPERGHGDTRPTSEEGTQAATDYLLGIVSPRAAELAKQKK